MLPEKFNWPLFCIALALMAAPIMRMVRQISKWTQAKPETTALAEESGYTRDLQN